MRKETSFSRKPLIHFLVFLTLFMVKTSTSTHNGDPPKTLVELASQFPDIDIPVDTLFIGLGDAWMISEEDLPIYNIGSGVLEVFDISSDMPQFYAVQRSLTISAHEHSYVPIIFDPEIEPSNYQVDSAVLTIYSNDPDENVLSVFVRAEFTPWHWDFRGDANGDGTINVLDVLAAGNHILGTITLTGDAL